MTTDSETTEQYLNLVRSRFLISVLVFVSRDFELGRVSVQFMPLQLQLYLLGGSVVRRRPSVPYRATFYYLCMTSVFFSALDDVVHQMTEFGRWLINVILLHTISQHVQKMIVKSITKT